MLTPLHLPVAQMASLSVGQKPGALHTPSHWETGRKVGRTQPRGHLGLLQGENQLEAGQALGKATGQADLILEAPWEVAHEEVGLVALHLAVLHGPLPQQGVEVHGQHCAGPLLIPGGLLA